jgi:hypothetical protein
MIAKSEHFIDVDSGSPGLKSLRIGEGKPGSLANIDVSDSAPASRAPASRARVSQSESKNGTRVQEKGIWERLMDEK